MRLRATAMWCEQSSVRHKQEKRRIIINGINIVVIYTYRKSAIFNHIQIRVMDLFEYKCFSHSLSRSLYVYFSVDWPLLSTILRNLWLGRLCAHPFKRKYLLVFILVFTAHNPCTHIFRLEFGVCYRVTFLTFVDWLVDLDLSYCWPNQHTIIGVQVNWRSIKAKPLSSVCVHTSTGFPFCKRLLILAHCIAVILLWNAKPTMS